MNSSKPAPIFWCDDWFEHTEAPRREYEHVYRGAVTAAVTLSVLLARKPTACVLFAVGTCLYTVLVRSISLVIVEVFLFFFF